jgi:hypothetical protein
MEASLQNVFKRINFFPTVRYTTLVFMRIAGQT